MGCLVGSAKRYFIFIWLILSVGLLINGCEETRIAWRCTAAPVAIDVEQIEKGVSPGSDYLTLGPHIGLVDGGVYEYTVKKGHEKDPVTDSTPIDKLYYPAFSKNHPLAQGEDPAKAAWFKVLIETERYKTVGAVKRAQPEGTSLEMPPITGVVINTIDPLSTEERKLLQEGFPLLSLDAVTVLEEGRVPMSRASALALLLAGVLVLLAPPIGYAFYEMRKRSLAPAPAMPSPAPLPSMAPAHLAPGGQASPYGAGPNPQPSVPPPPVSAGWPVAAGSVPPPRSGSMPPAGLGSMAPASARFAPGARVCITRNGVSYFGSVLKAQQGQVYVDLDDGRKVWVGQELVTFA